MKQKNLALLDRRLELKNKFESYVDERLKNYLEPELNINAFKENYENMTKMAGDACMLFNKDISEKIMRLAERFEELKTSVHYNSKRTKKMIWVSIICTVENLKKIMVRSMHK